MKKIVHINIGPDLREDDRISFYLLELIKRCGIPEKDLYKSVGYDYTIITGDLDGAEKILLQFNQYRGYTAKSVDLSDEEFDSCLKGGSLEEGSLTLDHTEGGVFKRVTP